jgi:hypothetical protein
MAQITMSMLPHPMDPPIYLGRDVAPNVTSSIVMTALDDTSAANKMQEPGLTWTESRKRAKADANKVQEPGLPRTESRKRAKAEKEDKVSKLKPNTFHREEKAGRNAVGENGTHKATSFDQGK